jgi:hypothetical protein
MKKYTIDNYIIENKLNYETKEILPFTFNLSIYFGLSILSLLIQNNFYSLILIILSTIFCVFFIGYEKTIKIKLDDNLRKKYLYDYLKEKERRIEEKIKEDRINNILEQAKKGEL